MKTLFGSIIVAGSGKIGGHVASRNRAGSYLRTKVSPVNPQTASQTAARNRLSSISTAWAGLGASSVAAWNNAVTSFQGTDVFGNKVKPSGFNLHQKLNNNLARIGVAVISTPPLPVSIPVIETGVIAAAHGGAITVTFTTDPNIVSTDIIVSATPAQSPGKSYVKSEFRDLGKLPTITSHVATLTTLYNAKFGAVGAAGQKVFVKLQQISKTTGQAGVPVVYSAIIS
jgi:hypothetical protein